MTAQNKTDFKQSKLNTWLLSGFGFLLCFLALQVWQMNGSTYAAATKLDVMDKSIDAIQSEIVPRQEYALQVDTFKAQIVEANAKLAALELRVTSAELKLAEQSK